MTKNQALEILFEKIESLHAIRSSMAIIHWDAATSGVPEKSLPSRGKTMSWLSGEQFKRFISKETLEAVETLQGFDNELSDLEKAMIREIGREYKKQQSVPLEELQKYRALVTQSESIWEKARENNDFEMMLPYYEQIFDYQRRLCDWYGFTNHPYDALLDDYEKGANVEMLDRFFKAVGENISPIIKDIIKNNIQPQEVSGSFDIAKQRELLPWLTDFIGYDRSRGKVGEVEHPFCTSVSINDVRITTKYHQDNLLSALYSIIHESGHAIYEQNMDEQLQKYNLCDCASMGMHESQSRFYENIIGRNPAFAAILLPKLQEKFDYFTGWNEDMLYRAINIAKPSLIRIEADELTYSLHILIRYELEKALISGETKVKDLPELWADKYEEVLGIRPKTYAEGVLQDVHWSCGYVGYFPSYAVGTAYGVQMLNTISKTIDINKAIGDCDISPITNWLKENIHRPGATLLPDDLLKQATQESFNPIYYVNYLKDKFTKLYLN